MTSTPTGPDMTGNHRLDADATVPPEVAQTEDIDHGAKTPGHERNRAQSDVDAEALR